MNSEMANPIFDGPKYTWLQVGKFWRQVLSIGNTIPGEMSANHSKQTLFLMVPGNPGAAELYEGFGTEIMANFGSKTTSFWCVSHINHVGLPENFSHNHELDYVGLKAQVEQLVEFYKQCVPKNAHVYLIGHSGGCSALLQALQQIPADENGRTVEQVFCIQPCIESVSLTECGKSYNFYRTLKIQSLVYYILLALKWLRLPKVMASFVLRCLWVGFTEVDERVMDCAVTDIALPRAFWNAQIYGRDIPENLDEQLINNSNFREKMTFFYGLNDGWCNEEFGERMAERLPGKVFWIAEEEVSHGFYCYRREWNNLVQVLAKHVRLEH